METKGIYKYYQGLPGWGKGLVAIGTLAGLTALYFVGRNIVNNINAAKLTKDAQATVDATKGDLATLATQGQVPSYSASQFKIWADAAESCYQGWGTCEGDTIFINMKNDADVLALIQAFGVRTISSGRFNPEPDFTGDLPGVLRNELSSSDVDAINQTLSVAGIKYQF